MGRAAADLTTPISVVTGFLGSGKTTLLNALLRHPDMAETAVLVNEFGEMWPEVDRRSRLVVIVRDLDVEPIARSFRRLVGGTTRSP